MCIAMDWTDIKYVVNPCQRCKFEVSRNSCPTTLDNYCINNMSIEPLKSEMSDDAGNQEKSVELRNKGSCESLDSRTGSIDVKMESNYFLVW